MTSSLRRSFDATETPTLLIVRTSDTCAPPWTSKSSGFTASKDLRSEDRHTASSARFCEFPFNKKSRFRA